MNKVINFALLLATMFFPLGALAQIIPFYNYQTPEIASLGTFGNIPVGMFTGVPEINVPMFEVTAGNYTLPISASYHLANVRPFPSPGILGLGWSLNAGGYITRTVRGFPDEKKDSQGHAYGFLGHYGSIAGISSSGSFRNALAGVFNAFMDNTSGNEYELMSDEYGFSFCGHSGHFYLNGSGEWVVVSDEDIKVLFSISENTVSLSQIEQSGRLSTTGWTNRNQNDRFISGFTLVTPEGCKYEFGGLDATEFSISYYNRANSNLIATTWHLSKITTPEGREINLIYKSKRDDGRALIMCDLRYSPQRILYGYYNNGSGELSYGDSLNNVGWNGFTGFLLFPAYLKEVSTPNETVRLSYRPDPTYTERLLQENYSLQALYWSRLTEMVSRFGTFTPADQFFMFIDGINYDGTDNQRRQRIASRMSDLMLDTITITSSRGGGWKKAIISYDLTKRRKMTFLNFRDNYRFNHHYEFKYNPGEICYYYPMAATDSWGYSTGNRVVLSETPTFQYIPSSQEALMRETLSEITFPTGGKSCFEYELNTYSKRASYSATHLINGCGQAGGLRVSRIVNKKKNGDIDNIRKFYYCENIADSANTLFASSGVLAQFPMHIKNIQSSSGNFLAIVKSKDAFSVPITADVTPTVGYSSVIEKTSGPDGSTMGWVRRRFSNFDTDPYGMTHQDTKPIYRLVESDSIQVSPVTSLSYERGKLMSEEFFGANGSLVRKRSYRYDYTEGIAMPAVHHEESLYSTFDGMETAYLQSGCMTRTHVRRYFETSVEDSVITPAGVYSTKESMTYNAMKQPKIVTTKGSDSKDRKEMYTYAHEKASSWGSPYSTMASKHILTPLESVTKSVGSQIKEIETASYSITTGGVPYAYSYSLFQDSQRTIGKEHYRVLSTDEFGNPMEVIADSLLSVLVWSYQGQRMIARIDNVPSGTATQLRQWFLGLSSRDPVASDYNTITQLRASLHYTHFHIYHYDGWLKPQSYTSPDGHTTYYKYDNWGKLHEEYFYDSNGTKHILNQYDYKYDY